MINFNPFKWDPFKDKRSLEQLVNEELITTKQNLFFVRGELENNQSDEAKLVKRVLRLEAEQRALQSTKQE